MLDASNVIAHRGWQDKYPENTLLGIQKAIDAGVLHIECDVQVSADGYLVLCHDEELQRLSGQALHLNQLTLAEMQQLSCYEPGRLGDTFKVIKFSALQELLVIIQAHPTVTFYVEIKEEAVEKLGVVRCLTLLQSLLGHYSNVIVISFNEAVVAQAKASFNFQRTAIVLKQWCGRNDVITRLQADLAYVSKRHLPDEGVLSAAVPLAVYEVAEQHEAEALLARGISMIESFCAPDLLR